MLKIGQSVYLEGGGEKGLATVAAYRAGRYVMLDARNLGYRPEVGATMLLRMFDNGSYLNYRATNGGYLLEGGIITLVAPRQVDANHRRASKRYFLNLPVRSRFDDESDEQVLLVKDVSVQGVRFVHEAFLEIGTGITFRFSFGLGRGQSLCHGRIVRRDEQADHYAYGVLYDDPEDDSRSPFSMFLSALETFEEYGAPEPESDPPTPIGQSLTISIGMRTFISRIRGYRSGEWLITDIPSIDSVPITAIRDGEIEASVRYLRDGVALGFKATLRRQYTSPAPVWIWDYPDRFERSMIRQSLRFRTALHADIEWDGGEMSAMMVDISQGGGRLVSVGEPPQKGDTLKLALHLSDGQLATGVIGDVRFVSNAKGRAHIGLSFRRDRSLSFERLNRFLDHMDRQRTLEKQI